MDEVKPKELSQFPVGAQALLKALSYENFCFKQYQRAEQAAEADDKVIWQKLCVDTYAHVKAITEALRVRYGVDP